MPISDTAVKPKVLIVEDESIVALDVQIAAEKHGYDVVDVISTGEEALTAAEEYAPDVVLMDINLSGKIDGVQAAETISGKMAIPVIYLTAFSDDRTLERAKYTQPFGYINKPFSELEIKTSIEMALYKHSIDSKLKENETLLSATLTSIEDIVISTNTDLKIQYMNPAVEKIFSSFDHTSGVLLGKNLYELFQFTCLETGNSYYFPVDELHKEEISDTHLQCIVTSSFNKSSKFMDCSVVPKRDLSNKIIGYVFVLRDMSAQKTAEAAKSRLLSIIEFSEDAIIGASPEGTITDWNTGAEKLFGYSESEVQGKNLSVLTPSYHFDELPQILDEVSSGKRVEHFQTIRKRKDNSLINISMRVSPIINPKNQITGVSIIARDITEQIRLEKEILEVSTRERNVIGQELHDNLGQLLTGISFKLKVLQKQIGKKHIEETRGELENVSELIRDSLDLTKNLAKGVFTSPLDQESLDTAIIQYSEEMKRIYKKQIKSTNVENIEIDDPIIRTQVFMIAKEAINNACKYAQSEDILISLIQDFSELTLTVEDDGAGIQENRQHGLGFRIMKYRANMIDGYLNISSQSGKGTKITLRVPVPNEGE
ncbi:MAG: PAS domain S-box protein [Spirochaetia bacterium]